jgi:hypothetical protein
LVRLELNDSGATALWASTLLDQFLIEALRQLGRDLPLESATSLTSVADQAPYALPAGCVRVTRVEHPSGFFRVLIPFAGGDVAPGADLLLGPDSLRPATMSYDVYGGNVILSPAPDVSSEAILVRYEGAYSEPSADGSTLDVAARDEDLAVNLVCALAMRWIGMDEGKRQRFARERGADPMVLRRDYLDSYRAQLRARLSGVRGRRLVVRG